MSLKRRLSEPGLVVSALVHVGVLAATLIAFSSNEKFDDIQETVPVDVVTENQFNQIMKGDKSAKEVRPDVDKAAQAAPESAAPTTPPTPEKSVAAPPPPPPPPPPLPPVRDVQDTPPAPPPPPPPDVLPPPRPAPPQPDATPPVPTPPVRDVAEEPDLPKPVPKPPPRPVVKPPPPMPPVVPHPVVAKAPEPKPIPKPRPVDKPKPDQLAKLMQDLPTTDPTPAPSKSRQSQTPSENKFDLTDITKLLSSNAPAQRPSASRETGRLASLGSPTASAPKMSPSFWAGLDGVMEDQYRQCWSYLGLNTGVKYVPQIRVVYSSSGSLEGEPVLVNPPSDPSMRSLADSALRAVRRCNPLKIPEQYAPYYDQWKGRVLRFDPEEMAG